MTLTVGDKAPLFTLPTDQEGHSISLSELHGHPVLLYFYPKDNTPGCTKEACDFRDRFSQFKKAGIEIFGISKDSQTAHQKFKSKYQLPFTLLVDKNGEVCEAYGVFKPKSMFGKTFLAIERSTFLIDKNGVLTHIWRKVDASKHVEQILHDIN